MLKSMLTSAAFAGALVVSAAAIAQGHPQTGHIGHRAATRISTAII
jgi:hypothetical protein